MLQQGNRWLHWMAGAPEQSMSSANLCMQQAHGFPECATVAGSLLSGPIVLVLQPAAAPAAVEPWRNSQSLPLPAPGCRQAPPPSPPQQLSLPFEGLVRGEVEVSLDVVVVGMYLLSCRVATKGRRGAGRARQDWQAVAWVALPCLICLQHWHPCPVTACIPAAHL